MIWSVWRLARQLGPRSSSFSSSSPDSPPPGSGATGQEGSVWILTLTLKRTVSQVKEIGGDFVLAKGNHIIKYYFDVHSAAWVKINFNYMNPGFPVSKY